MCALLESIWVSKTKLKFTRQSTADLGLESVDWNVTWGHYHIPSRHQPPSRFALEDLTLTGLATRGLYPNGAD